MAVILRVPEPVATRILEFVMGRKTGWCKLNFREGTVLTADVQEHIPASLGKVVDNVEIVS